MPKKYFLIKQELKKGWRDTTTHWWLLLSVERGIYDQILAINHIAAMVHASLNESAARHFWGFFSQLHQPPQNHSPKQHIKSQLLPACY